MPGRGQKELFEMLIREVKVRECLYNIRHPGYKDRHNTEMQWGFVAQAVGMSVLEVKRLWGTLRSSYTRSVKNSIITSGSTTAQKRTPWYLEDEMAFLRPHLQLCLGNTNLIPKQEMQGVSSPTSLQSPYGYDQHGEIRFGNISNIKVENMCEDTVSRRSDLEEGEILPEDLVTGTYMLTPQFPERRYNNDCTPQFTDCNTYVSPPQFPVFPEKRARLDGCPELGDSGLNASGPLFPERRARLEDGGTKLGDQGQYVTTSSPTPMPTYAPTPTSSTAIAQFPDRRPETTPASSTTIPQFPDRRPEATPTSSTVTPQFFNRRAKLDRYAETSDYSAQENVRKDDAELEFFMGLMPRYKELNKKNKRKFEMQTISLLYTILDEQDDEENQ